MVYCHPSSLAYLDLFRRVRWDFTCVQRDVCSDMGSPVLSPFREVHRHGTSCFKSLPRGQDNVQLIPKGYWSRINTGSGNQTSAPVQALDYKSNSLPLGYRTFSLPYVDKKMPSCTVVNVITFTIIPPGSSKTMPDLSSLATPVPSSVPTPAAFRSKPKHEAQQAFGSFQKLSQSQQQSGHTRSQSLTMGEE